MANYPIYRLIKGSTLTFTEMDGNLEWLSRTMSASIVTITGSSFILGNLTVSDGITGSLFGTSSWAVSASYVNTAISSSYPMAVTGSTLYSFNAGPLNGNSKIGGIFLGEESGRFSSLESSNVIGYRAGYLSVGTGYSNIIGYEAAYSSSGAFNTLFASNVIGYQAGQESFAARQVNFIGPWAGWRSIDTEQANFVGASAGEESKNTKYSNFLGSGAGFRASSSQDSNFIGREAGNTTILSNYSNFIGASAGRLSVSASYSNFIGYFAGFQAASASNSTLIGYQAGYNAFGGALGIKSNNIIIGTNITLPNGRQDSINLGAIIFATGSYSSLAGLPFSGSINGRVGINQPNPTFSLDVSGSGRYTNGLQVTGSISVSGSISGSNATLTGTLTVQTIVAQTITASTEWITGSSKFGSLVTDTHQFTGSLLAPSITGSLQGTSSWAVSASWAPSSPSVAGISSYISSGSVSASVNTDISASFRLTSGSNTLLNVTKDGFVWIGNGSFVNQGYQLDVQGAIRATTTETYFDVASFGSTFNSRRLYVYVDPSGVGISNAESLNSQSVYLENQTGGVKGGIQFNTHDGMRLYISASGQIKFNRYLAPFSFPGTPVGSLSYDSLGNIITTPFSTSYISTGSITASVNADPTASFKVTSGSRTLLTLTNTGNVVIGTPGEFIDYPLEVSGAIKAEWIYCNSNGSIASSFYGTGQLLTGAAEQPVLYLESTWNTTAAARGIEYNVTNTASSGSSKLLNLKVDNVSVFNVSNSGSITTNAPTGYANAAWKLGDATAGTVTPDTYIKVEINGQIYSIPALLGTP